MKKLIVLMVMAILLMAGTAGAQEECIERCKFDNGEINWNCFSDCWSAGKLNIYSVSLPKIEIHYVTNPDLMPNACGGAPGCVLWTKIDGVRTNSIWILSKNRGGDIIPESYNVLGHEIQHIVNSIDSTFINPDLH